MRTSKYVFNNALYDMIKFLKYTNKLTSYQKFASRVGYMGAAFLMAGQWTLEPILFYNRFYMCYCTSIIT